MINPKVYAEAELFTDSKITIDVLERVAARIGQPLHVPSTAEAASVADRAARVQELEYRVLSWRKLFVAACKRLGEANRRMTVVPVALRRYQTPKPIPLATVRQDQAIAMGQLNRARHALKAAERAFAQSKEH